MISTSIARTKSEAFRRTLGYYSLFICLGLSSAIIGPTLPSLAAQTHTQLGSMGQMFLFGSAGYSLGTIVGGRLLDRVRGHPVLGIAQLCAGASIFFIPIAPWFWLLLTIVTFKGFAEGFINTGANLLLIWTHGEKVSPYMNGLHFFFGLGAVVAPFLVAQEAGVTNGYHWVYWALAAFMLLVGLRMLTLPGSPHPVPQPKEGKKEFTVARKYYPLVVTAALFLFFYVGAEITLSGWVYTYAVTLHLASAVGAAYLNSGFWLAFTLGRLISIPAATRFKPRQILPAALFCCLSLLAVGILFPGSRSILWIMTLGLGFCMAPIWPTGFTLAGQSINMTGRISGIVLLGDSFGGMVLPWLVGQVIGTAGPRVMVPLIFGSLVMCFLAFVYLLRLGQKKAPRVSREL
ncbi:MAG: MFS transporter [Anaerolineales bacterium]|jgi:FHS family Na+ dependent glucose MFS transporter 1